ncbi:MAG: TetR family transcriptional regulator [Rhodobacteraceae bacterium]|nr:TetR family transcriptional regulator [Paracoccaceae bacterium]MBR29231.1 TetR family transcriptional regulator [Paracoccaceae bacterium]
MARGQGDGETPDPAAATLSEAELTVVQNESLIHRRREQICQAALELFLEKGFASTTIRDICAKSGVNQASIYDYIANKNDILRRLLNQLWFNPDVPTLPEMLRAAPEAGFEEVLRRYLREAWEKKRKGTLLVYRSVPHMLEEDRRAMRVRDKALLADLSGELAERVGLRERDPRTEVMANMIIFMTAFGPMRDWLTRDVEDEVMLDVVAAGVAAMVARLAESAGEDG